MSNDDLCLAYECPISEVPEELLYVCSELGSECSQCDHRCPSSWVPLY